MQIPRATYRLQFNHHFRLADARALVPYLHELGISHIYASPLFKAGPQSLHGYDVSDFGQLNPELGTEAELARLADTLHKNKMGLVADIVPNHMGIGSPENVWWWDVLANGKNSRFAAHFDIDWKPAEKDLQGKILVPILGDLYETLLSKGEFQLLHEKEQFVLGYHEHRLPLSPDSTGKLSPDPAALKAFSANLKALDQLIKRQHYRLAFHEHGDAKLNYRRFFAVTSLAAVRVEEEKTFEATHALLRRWLATVLLDGVRVDHPDGLRDPATYLQRLRALAPNAWIVIEKILEPGESLPKSWPVQGTTGYDFLNQLNGLFIDPAAESPLTQLYGSFTGEPVDYPVLLLEKKRAVLKTLLAAELNRLTGLLWAIAVRNKVGKGLARAIFQESLAEVVACFPVYRSYITEKTGGDAADIAAIKSAVHLACENRKDLPTEIFALIHGLLMKPPGGKRSRDFVARFQQLTGAVMAKGTEDTAFYCFNRFVSQNEVGGDPKKFGISPAELHEFLGQQQKDWPHTQLTTSTHDTKRAEDVRARLNVLSEVPQEWARAVQRWSDINARHKVNQFPDRNAEYLFYQTLVGAWPLPEDRAQAYMEKATHEAKQHTDWTKRNVPYEDALRKFISAVLRDSAFIPDLEHFISRLSDAAIINSLAQTLVKLTAPGVPDIYQGCELWDFSLVDPDNRRPVDFKLRQRLLAEANSTSAEKAWERRAEGYCKLWLVRKTLKFRGELPDFANLNYTPISATGAGEAHVFAFARGNRIITIVPRLTLKLNNDWQDTRLELPAGNWHNEFTGDDFRGEIHMTKLFQKFPVALLFRKEND